MNRELLEGLEIDVSLDPESILEQLEQKQMEILSRLDNVHDETRRSTLEKTVEQIDDEIKAVKDEIKVMKTALVLDEEVQPEAPEEKAEQPKKKSGKKAKDKGSEKKETKAAETTPAEDALEAKANAVKEKAQEKKNKAEEEKRYNEEKDAELADNAAAASATATTAGNNTAGNNATGNNNSAAGNNSGQNTVQASTVSANSVSAPGKNIPASAQNNTSSEFATALHEYKVKRYDKAFPLLKKLAEEGDVTSQYIIAQMYKEGQGTKKDEDRWEYWISKAANAGEVSAQFDYGKYLVANGDKDSKNLAKGLDYLEKAGEQGDLDAVRSYYEIVSADHGTRANIKKALVFCQKLIETTDDSYDKEQLANANKVLKEKLKSAGKKTKNMIIQNTVSVTGAIMMLLALVYVFCGIHCDLRMSNEYLAKLPYLEEGFLLPVDAYWARCGEYLSYEGMFGLQLLLIAQLLKSIGNGYYKIIPVNIFCGITDIAAFALLVWHAIVLTNLEIPMETNLPAYLVMCFISLLPGMLLGNITKVALKWDN